MLNCAHNITEAVGPKFVFIIVEWDSLLREAKDDTALQEETVLIPNEEVRQEFILAIAKSKHKEMVKLIQIA